MYHIDPESVPAVCLDKATDWLAEPASDVQTTIADFEVAAATVSHIGTTAFARCRVPDCQVACKIFHVLSTEGILHATGVASEAGDTDLTNCVRK